MMTDCLRRLAFSVLLTLAALAQAADPVTLQLKWHHQFQFAGYYAAQALGYYRAAGLDVTIRPVDLTRNPAQEVIGGRAEFGVASTDLLLMRNRGEPVVNLASVFQHSPYVLLAMRRQGIESVHDLVGKRILIDPFATEVIAYLRTVGVPVDRLELIQANDYTYADLLSGRADAYAGYLTNDPYYLEQSGASFLSFLPRSAGIDFYGDNLFTTEQQLRDFPERVAAFREASLQGWRYAVAHPDKVIDLMIENGWGQADDRAKLSFEAEKIIQMIRPDLVEIGYMHRDRWQHVVHTYADLGMLPRDMSLDGFLYGSPNTLLPEWALWALGVFSLIALLSGTFATYAHRARLRLEVQIAQRERAENAELKLASAVYQSLGDALLLTDERQQIVNVNPAFTQLTGYEARDLIGRHPGMLLTDGESLALMEAARHGLAEAGQWSSQLDIVGKDGLPIRRHLFMRVIRNEAGSPLRHICIFSPVDADKSRDDTVWNSLHLDPVTGLPNRKLFVQTLGEELAQQPPGRPRVLSLLILDIDRFKEVNEVLGHYMGDQVLIETGRRLRQCVGEQASLGRLDGDKFAVLIPDTLDLPGVDRAVQCLLRAMVEPFTQATLPFYLSASIGIAQYPKDSDSVERLLQLAEQAMFVAKETGGNRRVYFSAPMQEEAFERIRLSNDLRLALGAGELFLDYQPIICLRSGKIAKAEALVRWRHPAEGLISPAKFIPLAERSGLIGAIGRWAFAEASRQLARWRGRYDLQLSINRSPLELRDEEGDLSELSCLRSLGLPGEAVAIEITEGLLLDSSDAVNDRLSTLRAAGIQLSLDDFGTGYSSLAYLQKIEIGFIKIDKAFVRDLETNPADQTLCRTIVMMAHGLGIRVIAEGVETAAQAGILGEMGCDFAQGFHFSRPLAPEDFETRLARDGIPWGPQAETPPGRSEQPSPALATDPSTGPSWT